MHLIHTYHDECAQLLLICTLCYSFAQRSICAGLSKEEHTSDMQHMSEAARNLVHQMIAVDVEVSRGTSSCT